MTLQEAQQQITVLNNNIDESQSIFRDVIKAIGFNDENAKAYGMVDLFGSPDTRQSQLPAFCTKVRHELDALKLKK